MAAGLFNKPKINGYSFLAEPGMTFVIAVQQGDGQPIVPLSVEKNIVPMVSGNPRALKLAEKNKFHRAIAVVAASEGSQEMMVCRFKFIE